jgi:hypothetical protein
VAKQLADCLVIGSEQRGERPDSIVLFLCQDPAEGEKPAQAMERLRPLAQQLRVACGRQQVPVVEALCVSGGRWWSYCCPGTGCCPPEGAEVTASGDSVMAAAATYAGVQVRGSLGEMEARLAQPATTPASVSVVREQALDAACAELLPQILDEACSKNVRHRTLSLVESALERFRATPPENDGPGADLTDDGLVADDEAAAIIIGLQDRTTRDQAAEWTDPPYTDPALRLWRALARRCVKPYEEHAAAPLTLAGWVAWSCGDETAARVAFGRALVLDPDYTFARLLHAAVNNGLDPEPLRHCLRQERRKRVVAAVRARRGRAAATGGGPGLRPAGAGRARNRR